MVKKKKKKTHKLRVVNNDVFSVIKLKPVI